MKKRDFIEMPKMLFQNGNLHFFCLQRCCPNGKAKLQRRNGFIHSSAQLFINNLKVHVKVVTRIEHAEERIKKVHETRIYYKKCKVQRKHAFIQVRKSWRKETNEWKWTRNYLRAMKRCFLQKFVLILFDVFDFFAAQYK